MGMVGISGRLMKVVAPNSPKDMVKANKAAEIEALKIIGNSICHHVCHGEAPKICAENFNSFGTDLITGFNILTTNGIATKECAIGTNKGKDLTSIGGLLKTSI